MTASGSLQDIVPPLAARKSLAEEAAEVLREMILLEKIAPGMPVNERELASALGISRTPLREAVRLLEADGLIEYSPTRRPFIANPDIEQVAQALSVLGALEALAGEQACQKASAAEIARIAAIAGRVSRVSEAGAAPLDFFRLDMEFHQTIVAASGNQPLIATHRQYNARLWRSRFISSRRMLDRPRTLREHDQVLQALLDRDGPACATALRRHLESTVANIRTALAATITGPDGTGRG